MAEVETQLEICVRLKYMSAEQAVRALRLCAEVGKLLNSIIQKLIPNP
jgi:four helix bundle protein